MGQGVGMACPRQSQGDLAAYHVLAIRDRLCEDSTGVRTSADTADRTSRIRPGNGVGPSINQILTQARDRAPYLQLAQGGYHPLVQRFMAGDCRVVEEAGKQLDASRAQLVPGVPRWRLPPLEQPLHGQAELGS